MAKDNVRNEKIIVEESSIPPLIHRMLANALMILVIDQERAGMIENKLGCRLLLVIWGVHL